MYQLKRTISNVFLSVHNENTVFVRLFVTFYTNSSLFEMLFYLYSSIYVTSYHMLRLDTSILPYRQ